jgi:hypothetical protein
LEIDQQSTDRDTPLILRKAQDALKKYEDMTFSDEEIDAFFPKELRKG